MILRQGVLPFPPSKGTGPANVEQVMNLPRSASDTAVLLSGFDVQYVDADKWLYLMDIDLRSRPLSNHAIEVSGEFGLRDSSGLWDDRYGGSVRYTLLGTEADEKVAQGVLNFPPAKGTGPRSQTESVQISNGSDHHTPALTGVLARFSDQDRVMLQLQAELTAQSPAPGKMDVTGTFGLRDGSGNWDDRYDGLLRYAAVGASTNGESGIRMRTGRLDFTPHRGSGPLQKSMTLTFAGPIRDCAAVLTGFHVRYHQDNIYLQRVVVDADTRKLNDHEVEVVGRLGIQDITGTWDETYSGGIQFAVLATT